MLPPADYIWHQRDAQELRHEPCGEIVKVEVVDLHERDCTAGAAGRDP